MQRNIKYPYMATFISSIFLYWIPYEIGGSLLRWILGLMTVSLFLYTLRQVVKSVSKENRSNIVLWQTNALALLHLGLIYISLTFRPLMTLILGILLSTGLYLFLDHRVKQMI